MKTAISALLLTTLFVLVGCNTFQGIGQDIQKGGQVLEDAAKKK